MSDSKFITIIRPDFMDFCGDACRAAAFNHLLFRIAGKSKDQPKERIKKGDILWYATTGQIVEEMSHAWGDCKVRKEVNALIGMGIIGRRSNPEWGADRTKHFCFGQKECKKFLALCQKYAICVVHLGLSPEVTHLIYSSNANDISIKCICSIHQMETLHVSNANDISIGAIPIDSPTIDDYKDVIKEESALVAAPSLSEHAHAFSEHENDSYRHDHTRKTDAWNCHNWRVAHGGLEIASCTDYQAWIERGGRETPTEPRVEAVKIGVTDEPVVTNPARHSGAAADGASGSNGVPGAVLARGRDERDGVALEAPQQDALRAAGAPQEVAIASTPGSVGTPLPAQTRQSPSPTDGATTVAESSESRASGKRKAHLSAQEQQLKAWLEEVRATELDLDARDVTAIRCLATKKGTDDKEMFLNIVAVLDSDPWFEEHHVSVDFYWINRQWNNKYMFLQRKKPAHPPNGQKTIGGYAWFGEV